MNKFFIIEARRLLPLAFLLALLFSLSVYDNFFRLQPADAPMGTTGFDAGEDFVFVTATRGEIDAPESFMLVYSQEKWDELQKKPELDLPDYPFNENYEVALCAINSKVKDVEVQPESEQVTKVNVKVDSKSHHYHLVMVNRENMDTPEVHWNFKDQQGELIYQEKYDMETETETETKEK